MIVVDASVVAKWLFRDEVRAPHAVRLLNDAVGVGDRSCAPPLVAFEVTNIIRQRMVREKLSLGLAHDLVDQFLALPLALIAVPPLHHDALTQCDAHALPAAYDAHYLALAQHLNCAFWTDDQRLLRLVGAALPFVRALDTYPTP